MISMPFILTSLSIIIGTRKAARRCAETLADCL
jgi:hypothetical protein